MRSISLIASLGALRLATDVAAAPASAAAESVDGSVVVARTPDTLVGGVVEGVLNPIVPVLNNLTDITQAVDALENLTPGPKPTSTQQAIAQLRSRYEAAKPSGIFESAADIILSGLSSNNLQGILNGYTSQNVDNNVNTREPSGKIYPKKNDQDAPYGQSEAAMRRQIFIPKSFTYGKKPPVILVPGTGSRGGNNFNGNLIPLLSNKDYADIVWINPPGFQLADAQQNAETVAYAVNYISGISKNRKVAIIGWSQGSLSMQWALKYWPSVRKTVSQQIATSADYHGTIFANLIEVDQLVPLPPAVYQQNRDSNFIKALRSGNGDSAYVPTTTIYSQFFDEIVQPQYPPQEASAYLKDVRKVGVTNNPIQSICKGKPAGGFNTHESVLSNALTHALIVDALTHGGPARRSRINLDSVCSLLLAPGLSLFDFLATESVIPIAGLEIGLFSPKVNAEPPLRNYAR